MYTNPSNAISDLQSLQHKKKMEITIFFKHVPNFSLQDWKCKETKAAEER
jgi:hypothetical protein